MRGRAFTLLSVLVLSSAIIFSFFLVFELDFGENVDFVMLFVWRGKLLEEVQNAGSGPSEEQPKMSM